MYVNGKIIPVETIPGMRGMKENSGGGEFKYDIFICCKNFYKCHNVPLSQLNSNKSIKKIYEEAGSRIAI
jgi:hypothetical protein